MAKYKFVGSGLGVPGLPHEVDEKDLDKEQKAILKAAIEAGNYEEIKASKKGGD